MQHSGLIQIYVFVALIYWNKRNVFQNFSQTVEISPIKLFHGSINEMISSSGINIFKLFRWMNYIILHCWLRKICETGLGSLCLPTLFSLHANNFIDWWNISVCPFLDFLQPSHTPANTIRRGKRWMGICNTFFQPTQLMKIHYYLMLCSSVQCPTLRVNNSSVFFRKTPDF